jgi:hypothetical protein
MTLAGKTDCCGNEPDRLLLDRRRAARAMSISVRLLDQIVKERQQPFVKCNRRVLFDPRDLSQWIETHKQNAVSENETEQ